MSIRIKVKNLSFEYNNQDKVLDNISFEVETGKFLTIAGPNGVGKSTLINLIAGMLKPKSGKIEINNSPIESYNTKQIAQTIAVVRQESTPIFDFSVTETVMMARIPYFNAAGFESKADREIVNQSMEATETIQFAARTLKSLSGGERQRVFIARALAQNTPILLLDEPTNFLDLKHQVGIYDLLKTAQLEKGKTIVSVTHDINLTTQYCDKILLLATDRKYAYGNPEKVLSADQIQDVFGVKVYESKVAQKKFFIPLGKFAKHNQQINKEHENQ